MEWFYRTCESSLLAVRDVGFYLLLAGVLVSFLDPGPGGEGRVPLDFFGRTVPLLTVDRRGSVAIIGLAGSKRKQRPRSSKN